MSRSGDGPDSRLQSDTTRTQFGTTSTHAHSVLWHRYQSHLRVSFIFLSYVWFLLILLASGQTKQPVLVYVFSVLLGITLSFAIKPRLWMLYLYIRLFSPHTRGSVMRAQTHRYPDE